MILKAGRFSFVCDDRGACPTAQRPNSPPIPRKRFSSVTHSGSLYAEPRPPSHACSQLQPSCFPSALQSFRIQPERNLSLFVAARYQRNGKSMRVKFATLLLLLSAGIATAQTPPDQKSGQDASYSTGRTHLPADMKTDTPPQGDTGPRDTGTGGAPAESPQGQTPPAMQAAPQGSSETIVGPK